MLSFPYGAEQSRHGVPDFVSQDGLFGGFVWFGMGILFCGILVWCFWFCLKASETKILKYVTAIKSAECCLDTSQLL